MRYLTATIGVHNFCQEQAEEKGRFVACAQETARNSSMAGKAIWKGYVHLKDVDVPVKVYTAVKESRVQFHLLHEPDGVRLKQQMVCAYEKTPVPLAEQTRGFELEAGKYILVEPSELEEAEPENSRMIEIHQFVKTGQVDSVFFDRVYYLGQDMPSKKFSVLVDVLSEMDVYGICTWTMRRRSYIGALGAGRNILRLVTLRYADEVISTESLEYQSITLSEKEIKIGSDLINQLTGPFEPEKFGSEHQKKLQELIDRKARGEKIAILRPKRLKPTAPDKLLETLEASLKKTA
jgi:DNA end-binding protein Ku